MKARKILTMALCAVLLVCISVGATVAYLTSKDEVKNTFTVGKVQITLDEANVDKEGVKIDDTRVQENNYRLMPNHSYIKDPTVTVKKDSEASYIRMLVTVSNIDALKAAFPAEKYPTYYQGDLFLLQCLVTGWDANNWAVASVNGGTYEFRYKETVAAPTADVKLDPLFDTIEIPETVSNEELLELQNLVIDIVAQAIQADGFADAAAAWDAWQN